MLDQKVLRSSLESASETQARLNQRLNKRAAGILNAAVGIALRHKEVSIQPVSNRHVRYPAIKFQWRRQLCPVFQRGMKSRIHA